MVFVLPSSCKLGLPAIPHLIIVDGQCRGGGHMSNSKNDDRTSLRLLKAPASTVWAIQETRSGKQECIFTSHKNIRFRLPSWSDGNYINSFQYADLTALGLPSLHWLFTGKAQHLHVYTAVNVNYSTSVGYVTKLYCYCCFTKKVKAHPHYF